MTSIFDHDNSSQLSKIMPLDFIRLFKPKSMFLSQAAFPPNQYDCIWLQLQSEIFDMPLTQDELEHLRLRISSTGAKNFYDTRSLATASSKKIPNQNTRETNLREMIHSGDPNQRSLAFAIGFLQRAKEIEQLYKKLNAAQNKGKPTQDMRSRLLVLLACNEMAHDATRATVDPTEAQRRWGTYITRGYSSSADVPPDRYSLPNLEEEDRWGPWIYTPAEEATRDPQERTSARTQVQGTGNGRTTEDGRPRPAIRPHGRSTSGPT